MPVALLISLTILYYGQNCNSIDPDGSLSGDGCPIGGTSSCPQTTEVFKGMSDWSALEDSSTMCSIRFPYILGYKRGEGRSP